MLVKYPVYNLEPSGPMINDYLRKGNPLGLSPETFQTLQVLNRLQFQPKLEAMLESGTNVITECYRGTGIAWGVGAGVNKEYLIRLNEFLFAEDIALLLDGKRFLGGVEKGHAHETNDELMERVRAAFLDLAKEFRWRVINANRTVEEVHENIWNEVRKIL